MKIISYNINGIRASVKLGLINYLEELDADIICIQEVRANEQIARQTIFPSDEQKSFFEEPTNSKLVNYFPIFNCGSVPGYAGTLTLTKQKPDKIILDMEEFWTDSEGRTTTIILGNLAVVNAYIPNGNSGRLDFKMQYLDALTKFINKLKENYNVICVGDFNIAHNEIDLTNPRECKNKSVFLPIERQAFTKIIESGFDDCFRVLNPTTVKYSWRSYRSIYDKSYNAWKYRIDYIISSPKLKSELKTCDILDLPYSDHCPVILEI